MPLGTIKALMELSEHQSYFWQYCSLQHRWDTRFNSVTQHVLLFQASQQGCKLHYSCLNISFGNPGNKVKTKGTCYSLAGQHIKQEHRPAPKELTLYDVFTLQGIVLYFVNI